MLFEKGAFAVDRKYGHLPIFSHPSSYEKRWQSKEATQYSSALLASLGYAPWAGFRSIRRQAATELARTIGLGETRRMLGHHPNSRRLELNYVFFENDLDLTALLMDEGGNADAHSAMLRASAPQHYVPLTLDLQVQLHEAVVKLSEQLQRRDRDLSKAPALQQARGIVHKRAQRIMRERMTQQVFTAPRRGETVLDEELDEELEEEEDSEDEFEALLHTEGSIIADDEDVEREGRGQMLEKANREEYMARGRKVVRDLMCELNGRIDELPLYQKTQTREDNATQTEGWQRVNVEELRRYGRR
ncbi:hypothetical protein LTR97_004135 [Elasticomyces elasticus]|uniref:Uncharacterized protein n=1 Tax=Elasticomyces elasticus TaxID=574655 RepID=A0AAN7WNE9_9PEZI|nr:hypothetical protein LTR97_004135 [Elasticomyces elasticus]